MKILELRVRSINFTVMANKRLKNKIHAAVEKTEDERLLSMINLVLENQSANEDELDAAQKSELDAAINEWDRGKGKAYTWEEVKMNILSKRRKKSA